MTNEFGPGEGFALWREAMRWQRAIDEALAHLELTHTQYLVLASAAVAHREAGEGVLQREIAHVAGLDEATTSRIAAALGRRGLLDRGEAFGDRRAWSILVPNAGHKLLARANPLVRAAAKRFFRDKANVVFRRRFV
jgi:DNA-binding MarR family transcriptional regulator